LNRVRRCVIGLLLAACGRIHFDPSGELGSCTDAIRDGNEQGIDCGGECLDCPGASCSTDATCVTAHCVAGFCELSTGPPYWEPGPELLAPRSALGCATAGNGEIDVVGAPMVSLPRWRPPRS
jgi:hypothetical protein